METIDIPHPMYGLHQTYYGIFKNNDSTQRMLAMINHDNDIAEYWEWSDTGFLPIGIAARNRSNRQRASSDVGFSARPGRRHPCAIFHMGRETCAVWAPKPYENDLVISLQPAALMRRQHGVQRAAVRI